MDIAKADQLFDAATETHRAAMGAAAKIEDADARAKAFAAAQQVWEMQREYQRKIRHGAGK